MCDAAARTAARNKQQDLAKQKLREKMRLRKRLTVTNNMLSTFDAIECEMADGDLWRQGIQTMAETAKALNTNGMDMSKIYDRLANIQDEFQSYVDGAEDVRALMADGPGPATDATMDDDLNDELEALLRDDEGDDGSAVPTSTPAMAPARVHAMPSRQPTAATYSEMPSVPTGISTAQPRARYAASSSGAEGESAQSTVNNLARQMMTN